MAVQGPVPASKTEKRKAAHEPTRKDRLGASRPGELAAIPPGEAARVPVRSMPGQEDVQTRGGPVGRLVQAPLQRVLRTLAFEARLRRSGAGSSSPAPERSSARVGQDDVSVTPSSPWATSAPSPPRHRAPPVPALQFPSARLAVPGPARPIRTPLVDEHHSGVGVRPQMLGHLIAIQDLDLARGEVPDGLFVAQATADQAVVIGEHPRPGDLSTAGGASRLPVPELRAGLGRLVAFIGAAGRLARRDELAAGAVGDGPGRAVDGVGPGRSCPLLGLGLSGRSTGGSAASAAVALHPPP